MCLFVTASEHEITRRTSCFIFYAWRWAFVLKANGSLGVTGKARQQQSIMVKRTRHEDSDAAVAAQQLEAAAEAGTDEVRKLKVSAYASVRQPGRTAPAVDKVDYRSVVSRGSTAHAARLVITS